MNRYWYHPESESYVKVNSEADAISCANQGCDPVTREQYYAGIGEPIPKPKIIILDFETFYGDGYSLSLKNITTESYIRDERFKVHGLGVKINDAPSRWVPAHLIPKVLEALDLENNIVVGHNLQFDGAILAWHYGYYPKLYIDTLALSRALVGPHSTRHGLKYIAELLCGMTKMDELSKSYNVPTLSKSLEASIADYCVGAPRWNQYREQWEAGDTELTYAIFKKMIPHFPKEELLAQDWTIRAFTNPVLYLDTEMLDKYIVEVRQAKADALANAGLENRDLLMSNPKFAQALEDLGVTPPTKITAKGKVTFAFAKTDAGLKELLEHENPQVQAIVAARLEVKSTIEETRAVLYREASVRGAWPVGYNYAGAKVTLRYSGNKGGGGNPQNLKRGGTLRKAIYAPEGYLIGVADLSQVEARDTLWLGMQITGPNGEEAKALQVMAEGGDIYGWFGTKFYGYEINKKDTPFERQISKSAVLGLGFGMGAGRFIEFCKQSGITGIDARLAEDIVKLYRNTFVGVRKFWSQCNKAVNAMLDDQYGVMLPFEGTGLIRTGRDPLLGGPALILPGGLCIKYPGLNKDAEGQLTYLDGTTSVKLFGGKICENIVQAIAAKKMRMQKVKLHKEFWVAMTTHDELVAIVREGEEEKFGEAATRIMTETPIYMPGLPLGIEWDTAYRYGDAK